MFYDGVEGQKLIANWLPPARVWCPMVVVHFANRGARRADVGGWCNRFQRINPRGSGAATKEGRSDL